MEAYVQEKKNEKNLHTTKVTARSEKKIHENMKSRPTHMNEIRTDTPNTKQTVLCSTTSDESSRFGGSQQQAKQQQQRSR